MTLLFVENRHKTYFFEAIANNLSSNGHTIHWIIQNKQFLPKTNGTIHILDYPKKVLNGYSKIPYVEDVIKSDRQQNHFQKENKTYFYYYNNEIEKILKKVKPNMVFGESTAFHELLTIANCKQQEILYLNPSTCRYPIGRFSFYKYDTLTPYKGSDEKLNIEEAEKVIDQIINRKTAPDYMKAAPVSRINILKDQIKKIYSYSQGETYNTPNPLIKYKLEKERKKKIIQWDNNAISTIRDDNKFKVLYPLQMQPEANIDVWGRKYRNQTELINSIASNLPSNAVLFVKPNPKSKYELTPELINLVKSRSNIEHLSHSSKMDDVLPLMNLVVTVTGTIAIECVLSNKPVVTLVNTINNKAENCVFISNVDSELPKVINDVKNNVFKTLTLEEKINFINNINKSSYKGIISDPFTDSNCISEKNIKLLVTGFYDILKQ